MLDVIVKQEEIEMNKEEIEEEAMMESEQQDEDSLAFNDSSLSGMGSSGSRQWQKDETNQPTGYNISVGITTRDESLPIYDTPCKMYSSLRYKLHYKCSVNTEQAGQTPKLLMCRITVIDDESGKEIKKDNKPIIDDSLISLKNTSSGAFPVFEANHKVKFRSVSFHHNKSKWRLSLQLFSDSNHNINTPVFTMKSAPFQVYARRPKVSERDSTNGLLNPSAVSSTQTKEEKRKKKTIEQKKRKRSIIKESTKQEESEPTEQVTTTSEPVPVKEEIPQPNPKKVKLMETFTKTLDLLLKHHNELDEEDKATGFQLIQQKLFHHFYGCTPEQIEFYQQQQMQQQQECSDAEVMQSGSADELIMCDTNALFEAIETTDNLDFINANQSITDEDFSSFI